MAKINSELPNCMLDLNNQLNEYDFVLFHLYESNIQYREYYLSQRRLYPNRLMIFDNSAYEYYVKGEVLDIQSYYEAICELCPDYYILPDVLMDKEKTLKGVEDFVELYKLGVELNTSKSKPLAVAQGKTEEELIECLYLYKEMCITCVAIPFHNTFFKEMGKNVSPEIEESFCKFHNTTNITVDMRYAMGRVKFSQNHFPFLETFEHIHMLGSHSVAEKMYYDWIDTMDTGYPVKCAIEDYELGAEPHKPEVIIDEFLDKDLAIETIDLIMFNVLKFRNL